MTRKKSGFLTFCFSLIPGAGEMYMGFLEWGRGCLSCQFCGATVFSMCIISEACRMRSFMHWKTIICSS